MNTINAPPIRSMCGIDSLHIRVRISIRELFSFMRDEKLIIKEERRTRWTTEFKLILEGEKIRVVASKRGLCRFEFGGLYYSENKEEKLQLIRKLTRKFPYWKIQRLDFACDLKVAFEDIEINPPEKSWIYCEYSDSFYINRSTKGRTSSWIVYDKGKQMKIFSFPLTRIELRLFKGTINNRRLANCLNDPDVFNKCIGTIDKFFETLKVSIKGEPTGGLQSNARIVLENFIEFLDGDGAMPKQRDHFHMGEAIAARDKLNWWMNSSGVTWENLPMRCKKVQKEVCKEVGISEPTLRKAIHFAKRL